MREIFAEIVSMSWSKVAVSLSDLVGIFIEPFAGDVPIVWGGSSNGMGDVVGVWESRFVHVVNSNINVRMGLTPNHWHQ